MRKFVALALLAVLALMLAFAVVGCGGQQQPAEQATPEASPMSETPQEGMMADTSAMADTSTMQH
jgi:hypothetical protein